MSNYFEIAEKRGAIMLDASNFRFETVPLMSHHKSALMEVAEGNFELGYDDPSGSNRLRELIATHENYLESHNFALEEVVINCGGVTGTFNNLFSILRNHIHADEKNEVIIPVPAYPEIPKFPAF